MDLQPGAAAAAARRRRACARTTSSCPGDYPRKWLFEGWNWNEQYLLQSFLAFNSAWEVLFGTQWMTIRHPELLQEAFPGLADPEVLSRPGASFWIRRGDR